MKKYRVLFADLDGTLIETSSGKLFPLGVWDMRLKLDVLKKIGELDPDYFIIVSNQGGISTGKVDEGNWCTKAQYVLSCVSEFCPTPVSTGFSFSKTNYPKDPMRKPNVGMLLESIKEVLLTSPDIMTKDILMIGDASGYPGQFSDSDKVCAARFGIDYLDVDDFINSKF